MTAERAAILPGEIRVVERDSLPPSVKLIPEGLNPLNDGILMKHQADWLADDSDLKLMEKGRRTGITWAEAQDDTLIAASSRSAGGDNIFYIGDTKEKGLEFIGYCSHFLRFIEKRQGEIEEYLHEFQIEKDGKEVIERIAAYRIRCASGYQIVALSSRPANIRGLQGIVVIDEAAFHPQVQQVIDSCNALLIWGGKIRIISTHNGVLNAFNDLIKETREGKWPYSLHRVTFNDANVNGLYERVCMVRGWTPSATEHKKWSDRIRTSYGTRKDTMREELDAIPKEGEGTLLPLAWIEACQNEEFRVVRWEAPDPKFVDWSETARRGTMRGWLADHVDPLLAKLPERWPHSFGEDFAMRVDRTSIAVGYVDQTLHRRVAFIAEFRQCPYDQQKQALFHIVKRLPRFRSGILDANGNGMALAQEARQKFGQERIVELIASDNWLREYTPKFREAFESRTIHIPADVDVRDDLKQFQIINGVGKIPRDVRTNGTDGGRRHADSAIALLNFYAATFSNAVEIAFQTTGEQRAAAQAFEENQINTEPSITDRGFGTVGGGQNWRGY